MVGVEPGAGHAKSTKKCLWLIASMSLAILVATVQEGSSLRSFPARKSTTKQNTGERAAKRAPLPEGKKSKTCSRRCASLPNKIIVQHNSAGIGSISGTLKSWAELSASLCATFHASPPKIQLLPRHNHDLLGIANSTDLRVDPSLKWIDFMNITYTVRDFKEYGSPAVIDYPLHQNYTETEDLEVLETDSVDQFREHFIRAEKISFGNESASRFIWVIGHLNYYEFRVPWRAILRERHENRKQKRDLPQKKFYPEQLPHFHKSPLKQCQYVGLSDPKHFDELVSISMERFRHVASNISGHEDSIFGMLHLRRQDGEAYCNTTVSAVESYLKCSLRPASTLKRPIMIGFSTDETDMSYRENVTSAINSIDSNIFAVDLDVLVWRAIEAETISGRFPASYLNNFHVYKILQILFRKKSSEIQFHFERRRSLSCNECDDAQFLEAIQGFE